MKRRQFLELTFLTSLTLASNPPFIYGRGKRETPLKVLILGLDGLDPNLVSRFIKKGSLPHFQRLISQGGFSVLGTSIPPQSPVAWANFITGMDPSGHGIFDFMHRDPSNYLPVFSGTLSEEPKKKISLGEWVLPLSRGQIKLLRQGKAFWQILEEHDIPSVISRMPSNYPPAQTKQRSLSGMGTPDIMGSYGIFNYYTTESGEINPDIGGGRIHQVYVIGHQVEASLPGPVNPFRRDRPEATLDFKVYLDPVYPVAKIVIGHEEFILKEKEWSGWRRVEFPLIPGKSVRGICQFYLKEIRPHFKLYISPVHIDPANPVLPICTPADYSRELVAHLGLFHTKGLPADTSALDNNVLNEAEFLHQDNGFLEENLAMLDFELQRFHSGLLFFYLSSTDQRQHMFWRFLDENHPAYDSQLARQFGQEIENIYIQMDQLIARIEKYLDKKTVLIIMSDHGFNPFIRGFNLNTWLFETGYHKLRNPWVQDKGSLFEYTDWSRTKAYGLGLNGLYINLKGRESQGIVNPGSEYEHLVRELANRLEAIVDPLTGKKPIYKAYITREIYKGPYLNQAPDIILGFNWGYRISWSSPLGKFPSEVLEFNRQKWSGDHMGAAELIPGILIANRKIVHPAPSLTDVTATIFDLFGLQIPLEMKGRPVLKIS
ncbi:MAG: alkaline phosphatase family protein [Candidatus Aminicenantes bacterium]|nr:alkaline phosphatase family protein [Candidatus Aminicenantes bacterium]